MNRIQKQFLSWIAVILMIFFQNIIFNLEHPLRYLNGMSSVVISVMVMVWGRTVRTRVIHPRTRRCLVGISWSLTVLYFIRMCRWIIFKQSDDLKRFCWYLYYLPFLAVPLFSYHAAVGLRRKETPGQDLQLKLVWIIAILLGIGLLTNDVHHQMLVIETGDHVTHGWLYFVLFSWSVLLSVGTLIMLIRCCRLSECRKQLYVPLGMSAAGLLLLLWYNLNGGSPVLFGIKLYYMQEAYSLIFIGLWEGCIIIGLLPSNTGYRNLFSESNISAVLRDESNSVWYSSVHVQSSYDPADIVTQTKPIHGGSITWSEDIHTIRSLQAQLEEANERLKEENDLIEEENRIAAERTQYETQNRLYDKIAAHSRRQLAEIAESFPDTEAFTAHIRKNLLLGTYVKRSANLMLLADAHKSLSSDELMLSLRETMENLRLFGVDCVLQSGSARDYPAQAMIAVYDFAEAAAESLCERCSVFSASVVPDDKTVLLIETDAALAETDLTMPPESGLALTVSEADDTYCLRIGGAAHA